jgi:hypothetical protein
VKALARIIEALTFTGPKPYPEPRDDRAELLGMAREIAELAERLERCGDLSIIHQKDMYAAHEAALHRARDIRARAHRIAGRL